MKKIISIFVLAMIIGMQSAPIVTTYAEGDGEEATSEEEQQSTPKERKTVLPPLQKPSLLPGPDIGDGSGDEVKSYITDKFLPSISKRFITIVSVAGLLGLVYSGILFIAAIGEQEKVNKAKRAAMFSVLGLLLAILSFAIVQIITYLPLGT